MSKLRALHYYGGKSPGNRTGPWIARLLPQGKVYCEPFCGMAGVLLCRKPAEQEILNDADDHLINWWQVVKDEPKELGRLVDLTPRSRTIYEESAAALLAGELDGDPLQRALAYHVTIQQGMMQGLGKRGWGAVYYPRCGRQKRRFLSNDIARLSRRVANVTFTSFDAVDAVPWEREGLVLYLDPPYRSADTDPYRQDLPDYDEGGKLTEAVRECNGFVAISGYNDDWDHLGWRRHVCNTIKTAGRLSTAQTTVRTEILWTNKTCKGMPKGTLT